MIALPERRCWRALSRHHDDVKDLHLRELFAADPSRGERLVAEAAGLYLDWFYCARWLDRHLAASTDVVLINPGDHMVWRRWHASGRSLAAGRHPGALERRLGA